MNTKGWGGELSDKIKAQAYQMLCILDKYLNVIMREELWMWCYPVQLEKTNWFYHCFPFHQFYPDKAK